MMTERRLVVFKIWSQGRSTYEGYVIDNSLSEEADKLGRALVIWFNMSGGNSDGSYRRFEGLVYNKEISDRGYKRTPFIYPDGRVMPISSFSTLKAWFGLLHYSDFLQGEKEYGGIY